MAGRNLPEQFGEPVLEPDGPDGPDAPGGPGIVADDEFLLGTGDRRPGVTLALASAAERLRRTVRRRPLAAAVAAVGAAAVALGVAAVVARPGASGFDARVSLGGYRLTGTDQVVSTLTVANPTGGPVTLGAVAIGGPGGQNIGLGQAAVDVPIPAGASREVTVHGTLDCRADQPALPAQVQLTGTDARGRDRTVAAAMPGSAAFSAAVDVYRRDICRVPYPLGVTSIHYGGLRKTHLYAGHAIAMRLDISVAAVPGMAPTAVRFTTVISDLPGVRAMMESSDDAVTVAPGTTGTIDVLWVVDDCARVPAYAGIPALSVMGTDRRGTQTWDYALGDRFGADLVGGVAGICHAAGHR